MAEVDDCAVCGCSAEVVTAHKTELYQVYCANKRHRTSTYQYREYAVQAWNKNQRHKKSQKSKHG